LSQKGEKNFWKKTRRNWTVEKSGVRKCRGKKGISCEWESKEETRRFLKEEGQREEESSGPPVQKISKE